MCFGKEGMTFTERSVFSDILVVKIGGSSLSTAKKIRHAAQLIADKVKQEKKVVIIVSAMGKTTDQLMNLLNETNSTISEEHIDDVLSMGERTSARVFTSALSSLGVKAGYLDVLDRGWPVLTDGKYRDANILVTESKRRIRSVVSERLSKVDVLVIPGFIGKTKKGKITTIGRGGSDASAFVIGDSLMTRKIIFVSDVGGIMSVDPKLVNEAQRLDSITAEELIGIADSGRKFIHKKALGYKPAEMDVLLISNKSRTLDDDGTIIKGGVPGLRIESLTKPACAITIVGKNFTSNPELLMKLIGAFEETKVSIFGISMNHNNIVLYCEEKGVGNLVKKLNSIVLHHKETTAMAVRRGLAVVKVSGIGLQETPGFIVKASQSLRANGINIYGQFTVASELFILVAKRDSERAVELVTKAAEGET